MPDDDAAGVVVEQVPFDGVFPFGIVVRGRRVVHFQYEVDRPYPYSNAHPDGLSTEHRKAEFGIDPVRDAVGLNRIDVELVVVRFDHRLEPFDKHQDSFSTRP
ncbi:hypothetical protein [Rhodococcus sp. (in: high G+C Gram-positive bacteria)]|uniref:hypothetical protein n=1 Tax=Rhodococcus sp. TaxID=1831 RepID=UPI00257FCD8B|nr:hypothetical protein [Rhodococcus sp. (in: high G+C Gram-positive bacteria)]MBQ7803061.1 hypothetical protein [Rhodococcus sp. (in: high G+C Gram-positive bacteria)]